MLKNVKVPPHFEPPFAGAEGLVAPFFDTIDRRPDQGTIHVGGDRYILVRAEGLYISWFEAMAQTFGEEAAGEFIYNTAREIGRSDSAAFAQRLNLTDNFARLAAGPVHFSFSGWAFVEILGDSSPTKDSDYMIHYYHPNTFESEVLKKQNIKLDRCGCLFSAGYSAGWCTAAFEMELHGRELRCISKGDDACEFIMSPIEHLDRHEEKIRAQWTK
jgi:hypothetical protein